MSLAPEQAARRQIDEALAEAGWIVEDREAMNLAAGTGVAIVAAGRTRTSYGTSSRSSISTLSPEIGSVAATTRVLSPSASTGSRTTVKVRTTGAPSAIA